ncbi:MAG: hypothetical protein WDW36_004363 [Sanguina aurantia]
MAAASPVLLLEPQELIFKGVKLTQTYKQFLSVTNTLKSTIEASIKPGSADRYTVTPSVLRIRSGESVTIEVKLRVLKLASQQKAPLGAKRDVFHIKGTYFDQKFYSTFFLAAADAATGVAASSALASRDSSLSPRR